MRANSRLSQQKMSFLIILQCFLGWEGKCGIWPPGNEMIPNPQPPPSPCRIVTSMGNVSLTGTSSGKYIPAENRQELFPFIVTYRRIFKTCTNWGRKWKWNFQPSFSSPERSQGCWVGLDSGGEAYTPHCQNRQDVLPVEEKNLF